MLAPALLPCAFFLRMLLRTPAQRLLPQWYVLRSLFLCLYYHCGFHCDSRLPAPCVQLSAAAATFLRRVAKLAAHRIEFLCDKLGLSEAVSNQVWTALLHVLEANAAMLKGQHLDRIILCAIYGVCKVRNVLLMP